MSYQWSDFNICLPTAQGIYAKNALTGAVVLLDKNIIVEIEKWMINSDTTHQHRMCF